MEKQRITTISKPCRRLLIQLFIIFFLTSGVFSQSISASQIAKLRIVPSQNQNLYTKTDIKFELLIPKVKASQVQVLSDASQADVYFKSMKKSEDYTKNGTFIEIWYNFDKAGTYQLKPLSVIIQNRTRSIQFASVEISDDPSRQLPRIVIVFSNGKRIYSDHGTYSEPVFSATTGKKLNFTVNLQYATQLVQFNWELPKDSIFTQTKTFEITEVKYREKKPSSELIPVSSFEWTALTAGYHLLPKIKLIATGYDGYRNELLLPEAGIDFVSLNPIPENPTTESNIFDSAFSTDNQQLITSPRIPITLEDCQNLARLYSKERNSIFSHYSSRKNRQQLESHLELPVNPGRIFSLGQLLGAILFLIGSIIVFILSIREKKQFRLLISSALILISVVLLMYSIVKRTEVYGVCKGCTVFSIPDEKAGSSSEIGAGNKVRVSEQSGGWLFVQLGETSGWCKEKDIIIIK